MSTQKQRSILLITKVSLAVFFAFIIYAVIITALVNKYIDEVSIYGRVPHIYDTYSESITVENKIFYISHSAFINSIDLQIVETSIEKERQERYNHYNLGLGGSSPYERLTELRNIIEARPQTVVLGVHLFSISENWQIHEDRFLAAGRRTELFVSDKIEYPEEELLQPYKGLFQQNVIEELLYKRRFIFSSITTLPYAYVTRYDQLVNHKQYNKEFYQPHKYTNIITQTPSEMKSYLEKDLTLYEYEVTDKDNIQKQALKLIIEELQKNNIQVVLVKIPNNPLFLEALDDDWEEQYHKHIGDLTEEYNLPVFDATQRYDIEDYSSDKYYLNDKGRKQFSEDLGEFLAQVI